jgi:hypothetical protein
MNIRMGLYAVSATDRAKARTARPAVATYAQIAGSHGLSADLLAQCATAQDGGVGGLAPDDAGVRDAIAE